MTTVDINLSPDCKYLIVKTTGNEGNGTLTIYNNGIQVNTLPVVYAVAGQNECIPVVSTVSRLLSDVIQSDSIGIITVQALDNVPGANSCQINIPPGRSGASLLSSCELDCCLAKKVLELTKCDCNAKCDDQLAEAQKLHLYIQSMNTLLAQMGTDLSINAGIESQAIDVYNQAKQLCLTSCGCNC